MLKIDNSNEAKEFVYHSVQWTLSALLEFLSIRSNVDYLDTRK